MARRTARQLDADIAQSLGQATPKAAPTTPTGWKKLIKEIQQRARSTTDASARALLQRELDAASDGLRAASKVAAVSPTFVTDTNLFALTETVLEHGGPEFPARFDATRQPHIKRCLEAGLVELVGNRARLTPAGRTAVGDRLIKDIERENKYQPKENTFVPDPVRRTELLESERVKHADKLKRLEIALAAVSK